MKYMLLIYQDELALTETEREECYIESTQLAHDNGLEFAEHAQIAKGLGADIYFAHPYCSWERGTNENTNGLIRQYFPKGTDFNTVTDEDIVFVMDRLNDRPRASRGGKSPRELFLGQRVDLLAA
jgi:transposase, IS30 family